MPDVTTGFRICRDRVRSLGYRVEEVPGWESRGKGIVYPRVDVNHHDAIPGPSPVAGLRVCTFGRPGLENALCNTYGERGRNAAIWLVAAGVAWHAGSGGWAGWSGNSRALGRENANDGRGEPWHPDALAVQRAWDRVQAEVFGLPFSHYCEHKEWAPTRKPDRAGISGHAWRTEIANLRPAPTPTPTPTPIEEDEEMLDIGSVPVGERVTLAIDGPAVAGRGYWCWLSITPAGPPGKVDERTFEVYIETPTQGFGPGPVKGVGAKRYAWELGVNTSMVHIWNTGKQALGYSIASTKRP